MKELSLFEEVPVAVPKKKVKAVAKPKASSGDRVPVSVHVSDIHWRLDVPEYRRETGRFDKVIAPKLDQVFDYACDNAGNNCDSLPIFGSGDLFNGARDFLQYWTLSTHFKEWCSNYWKVKNSLMELNFFAVKGQHDMNHHNPKDTATSFNALVREGCIAAFASDGTYGTSVNGEKFNFYGCGWGEKYPEPYCKDENNILILHKTLWHKAPVFPGQTEGNIAVESIKLAALGYDIVFSGDNHKAFDVTVGGVRFYNLGALTRNSVDLADQQPRFCVLFSDMSVESVYVGNTDVFETERSTDDKAHANTKDEFSEALAGGFNQGDTFEGALAAVVGAEKCGDVEFTKNQLAILRDIANNLEA